MYLIDESVRARFLTKFTVSANGCWEWTAQRAPNGYGLIKVKVDGKWCTGLAHRVAYAIFHGQTPPDNRVIMHSCDNRGCVRPDHLSLSGQSENIHDMYTKKRRTFEGYRRGSSHGNAKLTEEQVLAIREAYTGKYGNAISLAQQYGVSAVLIKKIGRRESWKHI